MASSVSRQDKPILRYYWLPEQTRRRYRARSGLPAVFPQENFPPKKYNEYFIDQAFSVQMTGYCPLFLRVYGPRRQPISSNPDFTLGQ